jgi:hypothetical protein
MDDAADKAPAMPDRRWKKALAKQERAAEKAAAKHAPTAKRQRRPAPSR